MRIPSVPASIARAIGAPPNVDPADVPGPQPAMPDENPQVKTPPAEIVKPVEAEKPLAPQPLPAEAARRQANEAMRVKYHVQYAAAKTAEDQLALAGDMMNKADDLSDKPAEQYVLMDRARVLSANHGDTAKALEIVERMGKQFQIDDASMKAETLTFALESSDRPIDRDYDAGPSVADTIEQLARADQYDAAIKLGNLYRERARKPVNPAMLRRVTGQIRAVRDSQQESGKIAGARNLLKSNPNDAAANAAVGRYLCLFKADWAAALPP